MQESVQGSGRALLPSSVGAMRSFDWRKSCTLDSTGTRGWTGRTQAAGCNLEVIRLLVRGDK